LNKKNKIELVKKGYELPLMESFYTIQGEGFHKGRAAFFVRIGGCDIGCHWCDVKESWDPKIHPLTDINKIIKQVKKHSKVVVITGGEPLMWPMGPLTKKLQDLGISTHLETSGAYPLSGFWNWICLSPKKTKLPHEECYKSADELKIIVYNKSDFNFAELQSKKVRKECKLFLQPEWGVRKNINPIIVDFVLKNPKWKISLQTHKYLNIP
jgi:organic radical activating enzyme